MRVRPDAIADRLAGLITRYLRPHAGYATDDATGDPVVDFAPALSAAEQSTYADLLRMARLGITADISLAEFQAIKPALADMRTQRTRTDAQWSALTAAQRDTQLIAWNRDITDVLRALLRDS